MTDQEKRANTADENSAESAAHELLRQAAEALRKLAKACLVVAPTLKIPYSDAPRTSPWERFVHRPASDGYDLAVQIRRLIGPPPKTPDWAENDPWGPFGPPPTGWRAAPTCDRCKDTGRYQEHGVDAHCGCKTGRRMSELWYADKHGLYHPDMPDPEPPDEG